MKSNVIVGNNIEVLKTFPDNHFDSIVTDPPYGIDFLGKAWDANTGALETYKECLRVLKPGGHILAFSAARTYHHLAVTIEQAGFEIRDQIMWIYATGFPKSQDIGRQLHKKTNGNVEESKTYYPDITDMTIDSAGPGKSPKCVLCHSSTGPIHKTCSRTDCIRPWEQEQINNEWSGWGTNLKPAHEPICMGRKPLRQTIAKNCQQWGTGAINIDATRIPIEGVDTRNGGSNGWDRVEFSEAEPNKTDGTGYVPDAKGRFPSNVIGDIPEYQKFFYCPKVNSKERHMNEQLNNNHPTVKPIELMKYLIKLVTPAGGKVLDPFNGSGSTGCAAVELDYEYTGIDLDEHYVDISMKRIDAWYKETHPISSTFFTIA